MIYAWKTRFGFTAGLPDALFSYRNPNLGKSWRAFEWKMLVCLMTIWYNL
jgi:hypothetical protein